MTVFVIIVVVLVVVKQVLSLSSSSLFPLWLLLSPALWSAAAWVALAFSPPTLSLAGKRWMSARRGLRGNSKSERVAADGGTAAAARGSLV